MYKIPDYFILNTTSERSYQVKPIKSYYSSKNFQQMIPIGTTAFHLL